MTKRTHLCIAAVFLAAACSAAGSTLDDDPSTGATTTTTSAGGSDSLGGGGGGGITTGQGGLGFGAGGAAPAVDVEVVMTADNAYGFGYGDDKELFNYFGGVVNKLAGDIFNCNGPETYTVPAKDAAEGNYLYIIAYADKSTTQGVLGQLARVGSDPVYTGHGKWEVCATGQDFVSPDTGPNLAQINLQIPKCNAANTDPGTTSGGWVDATGTANGKVEFGEDNTTPRDQVVAGNEFPIACGIDGDAKWMWFNWDPQSIIWPSQGSPFIWPGGQGNPDKQFLIFRLAAENIPIKPN